MKILGRTMAIMGLLSVGYFLGTLGMFSPKDVHAQAAGEKSTKDKVKDAQKAVSNAQRALEADKTYQPVINGINAFATTVGGVDVLKDLEEGRGVDPETFAGLYAGQILAKHEMHLDKNANDQLTYKGKVIRMYSIDRLKKLYAKRVEIQKSNKTAN
jgi:hypothetical protein